MRTLVVEDDPSFAAFAEWLLRQDARQDVHIAGSLGEATGAMRIMEFDAILLDLELPDASGLDALDSLLRTAPDIPIIILTGEDDPRLLRDALYAGAEEFLVKGQGAERTLALRVSNAVLRRTRNLRLETRRAVEERDELVRQFLNEASHELRTPMTSIAVAQELLRHDSLDAKRRERLRRSLNRLRSGIEDFLGTLPPHSGPAPLDLASWAQRIDPQMANRLSIRATPTEVLVDEPLLVRGLERLLRVAVSESNHAEVTVERRGDDGEVSIAFACDRHPEEDHPVLLSVARRALETTQARLKVVQGDNMARFEVLAPLAPGVATLI